MKFMPAVGSNAVVKAVLLSLIGFLAWVTFMWTRTAEADYAEQDKRFRIHQYCVCIDRDGRSQMGCGFDCSQPGDECWGPVSHCFCPCLQE